MVVGGAAHHHPVHRLQLLEAAAELQEAAVEFDGQLGSVGLELVHQLVAQGRDRAVLLGVQAVEPGLAGMDAEPLGSGRGHGVDKGQQLPIGIALIDADPVLHRDRQRRGLGHGADATGHLRGLGH